MAAFGPPPRCVTTSGLWMTSYLHVVAGRSMPLQRMTSLRRRAQTHAAAASYLLRRVSDDGDCIDESIVQRVGLPGRKLQ